MLYQIKHKLKVLQRKILKSNFCNWLIGTILYLYTCLVFKTTKWEVRGLEDIIDTWNKEGNFILIGWHGRVAMLPCFLKHYVKDENKKMDAIVSMHQDGQLIGSFLKKFDISLVHGSSNRGANKAAVGLMRSLKNNHSITIIPDGPKGPRMHMGNSPLYFAQKTGKPIFGMTYSISKCKIIEKAWDKMMIPLPFSKGICVFSKPFYISKNITKDELEIEKIKIEKELNKMTLSADKYAGIPPVKPASTKKTRK